MKMPFFAPKKRKKSAFAREGKSVSYAYQWSLDAIYDNVTIARRGRGSDLIAWYVAEPQTWSFKSVADGENLIVKFAQAIAELVDSTIYIRATTSPWPVHEWARRAADNAPEMQPGFPEMLEADQYRMAEFAQSQKIVYFGVRVGQRGLGADMLSRVMPDAIADEMTRLRATREKLDQFMHESGFAARVATPAQMRWLIAKSLSMGCNLAPMDATLTHPQHLTRESLDELTRCVDWSAEPLAPTTRVVSTIDGDHHERHVTVLTVTDIAEIDIPLQHLPWMAHADNAGLGVVEMLARIDPQDADKTAKELFKLRSRVDSQMRHWEEDHGKEAPRQLARQADRGAEVEDEMRVNFARENTRTRSWFRFAVSGATPEQALEFADELTEHFKPQIRVIREIGQYHLLREFVPGEPQSVESHVRHFPALKVAAGLPQITARVGDNRGMQIAETCGVITRSVCFDPHFLTEIIETSGLVPIVGTLGSGKSYLACVIAYKLALSGVQGCVLDPAGRMQNLLKLPEIAAIAESINLLNSAPGTMCPYGVVDEPNAAYVALENPGGDIQYLMKLARETVRSQRRDLAYQTCRMCLPFEMQKTTALMLKLKKAIEDHNAEQFTTLSEFTRNIMRHGDSDLRAIGEMLLAASQRELGRVFFADGPRESDSIRKRLRFYNLKGLRIPPQGIDMEDYSPDEMLSRPIMNMAAWAGLQMVYRLDPHERKLFILDEAHELTERAGSGRTLTHKLSTDSRKANIACFWLSQNATSILSQGNIANFIGAAFVGRTNGLEAQQAALKLLGKEPGQGYEEILASLSAKPLGGEEVDLGYRDFIYRDGLGGIDGGGGMERIRVDQSHHPRLDAVLRTTADPRKRQALRIQETNHA